MRNILFLTAYPIEDASCRYRVHQFVPHLERAGYRCKVLPFATPRLFRALKAKGGIARKLFDTACCGFRRLVELGDLSDFEFVVIHREAFPFFAPVVEKWVLRRASARSVTQARRPSAIFSFDDAMYAGHDDVSRLNHPRLYSWKYGSGYDEVIRRSSHVLVGNRILAEYARKLNSNVSVIPTVVDCGKYSVKAVQRDASQPVTIGWMGSHSTAPYLSAIEPALRCLAKVHAGKVRFRFIGDPGYKLDVPQSESVPFQLDHEIEHLHSLDIGLMPLPDTEWTRGKCAFKAIQYMAGGVPVVASPVGVTLDVIQHNVNGLLARSADEWFHALDRLMCDLDLRERVAIAARRTVEEAYSLEVWGPRFVELFDQLGADQGILQPETVAA